ncbi:MAG: hypothetical protein DME32_17955 [Verrucomicrobia bacterium]|nr:MAG: hypothetical protein DME32_17955 [Verrucomicrobiota bacterium]
MRKFLREFSSPDETISKTNLSKMNTLYTILLEGAASKTKIPISSEHRMPAHLFRTGRHLGRALRTIVAVAVIALMGVLSSAALGANPAEEMAKVGTTDPKGNSWLSIQNSIEQFGHPEFILRLFLSLSLAVACAWAIAWHPRRSSLVNPLSDFEERKALILLGMVGAVVAELSGTSQTLAFVIFGIGALLRFRTLLDNPKLTGKAITVVVVGLACGMGSWAMAVFVTAFTWLLVFWLDTTVDFKVPRFTRTKDRWFFSSTSRRKSTRGSWKQRCERSCGSRTSPRSMLMWYKRGLIELLSAKRSCIDSFSPRFFLFPH